MKGNRRFFRKLVLLVLTVGMILTSLPSTYVVAMENNETIDQAVDTVSQNEVPQSISDQNLDVQVSVSGNETQNQETDETTQSAILTVSDVTLNLYDDYIFQEFKITVTNTGTETAKSIYIADRKAGTATDTEGNVTSVSYFLDDYVHIVDNGSTYRPRLDSTIIGKSIQIGFGSSAVYVDIKPGESYSFPILMRTDPAYPNGTRIVDELYFGAENAESAKGQIILNIYQPENPTIDFGRCKTNNYIQFFDEKLDVIDLGVLQCGGTYEMGEPFGIVNTSKVVDPITGSAPTITVFPEIETENLGIFRLYGMGGMSSNGAAIEASDSGTSAPYPFYIGIENSAGLAPGDYSCELKIRTSPNNVVCNGKIQAENGIVTIPVKFKVEGESDYSGPVNNLTAKAGNGFVELNWDLVGKDNKDIVYYVWRKDKNDGAFSLRQGDINGCDTSFIDTDVVNGETYEYQVGWIYRGVYIQSAYQMSKSESVFCTPSETEPLLLEPVDLKEVEFDSVTGECNIRWSLDKFYDKGDGQLRTTQVYVDGEPVEAYWGRNSDIASFNIYLDGQKIGTVSQNSVEIYKSYDTDISQYDEDLFNTYGTVYDSINVYCWKANFTVPHPECTHSFVVTAVDKSGVEGIRMNPEWYVPDDHDINEPAYPYYGEYTVSFDAQGGEGDVSDKTVKFAEVYGTLPTVTKSGYAFLGWFTKPEGGKKVTEDSYVEQRQNHTLYAQWFDSSVKVNLDVNGGKSIENPSVVVTFGETYGTLPTPVAQDGYHFTGWNTKADGTGESITSATKVTATSEHTLYAQWEANEYTITFDGNGREFTESKKVRYGECYGELPVSPFGGMSVEWYTEPVGGEKVTSETIVSILEDQTLYAHWSYKYTVATPKASVETQTEVLAGTRVFLSSDTVSSRIYYTTDAAIGAGVSAENGTLYVEGIVISESTTIYAVAVREGFNNSEILTVSYTVKDESADYGDISVEDIIKAGFTSANDVPSGIWVVGIENKIYNGDYQTQQSMHVYHHKKLLKEGTDYTVKYEKNKNAGNAKITIKGKNNYSETITKSFTIARADISTAVVANVSTKYNGKVQKKKSNVYYELATGYKSLTSGKDFVYNFSGTSSKAEDYNPDSFKLSNTYTVKVEGIGNYTGFVTYTETIFDVDATRHITDAHLKAIPSELYSESGCVPDVEMSYGGKKFADGEPLEKGTDYDLIYLNNDRLGTATVVIVGKNRYSGSRITTFKIINKSITRVSVENIVPTFQYNSMPCEQDSVKLVDKSADYELVLNTDYTIDYSDNVNAGTVIMVIKGIGKYKGTIKKKFSITPIYLTDKMLTWGDNAETAVFTKSSTQPKPSLSCTINDDKIQTEYKLVEGRDYKITYTNNKKIHDGTGEKIPCMTITFKGNFAGTVRKEFSITPGDLENTTLTLKDVTYQNQAGKCKPSVVIKDTNGKTLNSGTDYRKLTFSDITYVRDTTVERIVNKKRVKVICEEGTAVNAADIVPAGTELMVTVTGIGNYDGTRISGYYRVTKSQISSAKIKVLKKQIYNKNELCPGKPDLKVTVGNKTLTEDDYEIVAYSNNVNKGKAKITIRGIGNYGGVKTLSFDIGSYNLSTVE